MSAKPTIPAATPAISPEPSDSALEQFLDKNFRKILIGVILLIAAIVVVGILRHRAKEAATVAAIAARPG